VIPTGRVQVLRPVLELAWAVARAGAQHSPRIPPPRSLRPFLQFARLPDRALDAAWRAIDEDEEFRARLVPGALEEHVGRAGFLFVNRPEGWEAELAELEADAAAAESAVEDEQEERSARRRLRAVEDSHRKTEAAARATAAELDQARAALAAEQRSRAETDARLTAAAAEVDRLRAEAGSFRAAAERARSERAAHARDIEDLHAQLAAATAEIGGLRAAVSAPGAVAEASMSRAEPASAPIPAALIDVPALRRAIDEAAAGFARIGDALAAAASAIGPDMLTEPEAEPTSDAPPTMPVIETREQPRRVASPREREPRRKPVALPPAIFHDAPEAADHLVRLNGVVVLVDGYNVSHVRWAELPIAEQRRRVVDMLGELAARTGADVHVVFDGVEPVEPRQPPERRRLVRVSFSPSDTEADDVIVAMVGAIPRHRPVVVASNDRRVQTEASQAGANVISSDQLLAIIGR